MRSEPKKVAILNYAGCPNYGANLTAYALQEVCRSLGYDAFLVDRRWRYRCKYRNPYAYRFAERYLRWTLPVYQTRDARRFNHLYDAFIVGSDQVWTYQPSWSDCNCVPQRDLFCLDFVSEGKGKIAMAASFGGKFDAPEEYRRQMANSLSTFHAISVRESQGVAICRELLHCDAEHVLDPVFLLDGDDWGKIAARSARRLPERYVACCVLHAPLADFVASLNAGLEGYESINLMECEMEEWLDAIRHADAVITDSFHVVAFALIFRRRIVALNNQARGADRVPSIFERYDIGNRIVSEEEVVAQPQDARSKALDIFSRPMEYDTFNELMPCDVMRARAFLTKALEEGCRHSQRSAGKECCHALVCHMVARSKQLCELSLRLVPKIRRLGGKCLRALRK